MVRNKKRLKRNRLNIIILLILGGYASCSKSSDHTPLISGKWGIIDDSTKFVGTDTFPSYHFNYIGQASDYYDFRSDGNMYVREGDVLDTMAYEVLANNQVRCTPSPGFNDTYTTSRVTDTTAVFNIAANTPQGLLTKIINLRR
jgi:hypothetical protein